MSVLKISVHLKRSIISMGTVYLHNLEAKNKLYALFFTVAFLIYFVLLLTMQKKKNRIEMNLQSSFI